MSWFGDPVEWTHPAGLAILALAAPVLWLAVRSLVGFPKWLQVTSLVLRVTLLVFAALALCGFRQTYRSHQRFTVVAVDQSLSVSRAGYRKIDAFVGELRAGLSPDDRVAFVPFGGRPGLPCLEQPGDTASPDRENTDLARALDLARRLLPETRVPRIVVLTDGRIQQADAVAAAAECGSPVSVVVLPGPDFEVAATSVDAPERVRLGAPVEIGVTIRSVSANEGQVCLDCGSEEAARQMVKLEPGENRVQLTVAPRAEGWAVYTTRLEGFRDEMPQNNGVGTAVFVMPPLRALVVENRPGSADRVAAALRMVKIETDVRRPAQMPQDLEEMARYDLTMLLNTPVAAIPGGWMAGADGYVRERGCGLIAVGGDQSFTPGGYAGTGLEKALPLTAYSRIDKDKPSLAMVIVIDRSESMLEGNRIGLAKDATRRAVETLGPRDQIGVLAFDDVSQWTSPIRFAADKRPILAAVAGLKAEGRTNMGPALRRAHLALDEAFADLKHMIVLTDGLSQSGDFTQIAREIADSGITVSTLGVGREVAGPLLADMARIGKGRYYPCEQAAALPQIFAKETISAGKQGITEKAFLPKRVAESPILAGLPGTPPALLGYAETQAKPGSQVVLVSDANDPILAWWQCGRGKSAVFAASVDQRWAAAWLEWAGFDPFWQRLAQQVLRTDDVRWHRTAEERRSKIPPGCRVEFRLDPPNTDLLRSIAETTGGRFNPTGTEMAASNDRTVARVRLLWPYLLAVAIGLFVVDLAVRRVGLVAGLRSS